MWKERKEEREETCAPGSVSWRGSFKLQVGWNKGLPFKTVVPGSRPISELHSQHSIRNYLLASYPFALCINIMPLVACYILPKYKEVEEGLSKSSVEYSSNYKSCVSLFFLKILEWGQAGRSLYQTVGTLRAEIGPYFLVTPQGTGPGTH